MSGTISNISTETWQHICGYVEGSLAPLASVSKGAYQSTKYTMYSNVVLEDWNASLFLRSILDKPELRCYVKTLQLYEKSGIHTTSSVGEHVTEKMVRQCARLLRGFQIGHITARSWLKHLEDGDCASTALFILTSLPDLQQLRIGEPWALSAPWGSSCTWDLALIRHPWSNLVHASFNVRGMTPRALTRLLAAPRLQTLQLDKLTGSDSKVVMECLSDISSPIRKLVLRPYRARNLDFNIINVLVGACYQLESLIIDFRLFDGREGFGKIDSSRLMDALEHSLDTLEVFEFHVLPYKQRSLPQRYVEIAPLSEELPMRRIRYFPKVRYIALPTAAVGWDVDEYMPPLIVPPFGSICEGTPSMVYFSAPEDVKAS